MVWRTVLILAALVADVTVLRGPTGEVGESGPRGATGDPLSADALAQLDQRYVLKAGDTLSGGLTLAAQPERTIVLDTTEFAVLSGLSGYGINSAKVTIQPGGAIRSQVRLPFGAALVSVTCRLQDTGSGGTFSVRLRNYSGTSLGTAFTSCGAQASQAIAASSAVTSTVNNTCAENTATVAYVLQIENNGATSLDFFPCSAQYIPRNTLP